MGFLKNLFNKKTPGETCSVVMVAAGRASRMEGVDKILCPMGGEPLLLHTLRPFQALEEVTEIVIVTREDLMVTIGDLCRQYDMTKVKRVVKGGDSRTESVLAGIRAAEPQAGIIAIHDGARPFITEEIIAETISLARSCSAAAPAIPVKDTIKRAKDGLIVETPNRADLFAIQTPQVFEASLIRIALTKAVEEQASITDDCSAVERLGFPVRLSKGSEENIKITTPADLLHGEAILAERMGR